MSHPRTQWRSGRASTCSPAGRGEGGGGVGASVGSQAPRGPRPTGPVASPRVQALGPVVQAPGRSPQGPRQAHRLNSLIQLGTTLSGTTTRKGPRTVIRSASRPRKDTHCTVLPSPCDVRRGGRAVRVMVGPGRTRTAQSCPAPARRGEGAHAALMASPQSTRTAQSCLPGSHCVLLPPLPPPPRHQPGLMMLQVFSQPNASQQCQPNVG